MITYSVIGLVRALVMSFIQFINSTKKKKKKKNNYEFPFLNSITIFTRNIIFVSNEKTN